MEKVFEFWFKGAFKTILKDGKPITNFDESLTKSLFETWFGSNPKTDEFITKQFKDDLLKLSSSNISATTPQETLSRIIILDQFSRNIFRNSKQMFDFDQKALKLSLEAIDKGLDKTHELHPLQVGFFYLPLEHSESLSHQEMSVEKFRQLTLDYPNVIALQGFLKYAIEHYDLIKKFNRFPHRNRILERENTKEEEEYLSKVTNVFGVTA